MTASPEQGITVTCANGNSYTVRGAVTAVSYPTVAGDLACDLFGKPGDGERHGAWLGSFSGVEAVYPSSAVTPSAASRRSGI